MATLKTGNEGEKLPDDAWVIRACKRTSMSKEGKVNELVFRPSSADQLDPKKRLSVFAEDLTTLDQVLGFMSLDAASAVPLYLKVGEVHELKPEPTEPPMPGLIIEWHPKMVKDHLGNEILDTRPGADGHAGLRDLTGGNRSQRTSLRVKLAELAQRTLDHRRDC